MITAFVGNDQHFCGMLKYIDVYFGSNIFIGSRVIAEFYPLWKIINDVSNLLSNKSRPSLKKPCLFHPHPHIKSLTSIVGILAWSYKNDQRN